MERKVGAELVEFARSRQGQPMSDVILEAGYYKERNGKTTLNRTEFFKAMMEAQGIQVGSEPLAQPRRRQNMLKASARGVVPLSALYTSKIDIEPGDYVRVSYDSEDECLIIQKHEEPEDVAPSVCSV